jgi:hypothetical protein
MTEIRFANVKYARWMAAIVSVAVLFGLLGCGSDSSGTTSPDATPVAEPPASSTKAPSRSRVNENHQGKTREKQSNPHATSPVKKTTTVMHEETETRSKKTEKHSAELSDEPPRTDPPDPPKTRDPSPSDPEPPQSDSAESTRSDPVD